MYKNKGVIEDPRKPEEKALDYIAGYNSPIPYELLVEDWVKYFKGKKQHSGVQDSMACTHMSSVGAVEEQVKYWWDSGNLPQETIDWLTQYFDKWEDVSFSTRFNAILGGNTPQGNYFQKAWDTIRHDGVVPDKLLTTEKGWKTWADFHDKKLITKELKAIGQEFLKHFDVYYEVAYIFDQYPHINPTERKELKERVKQAPVQIGVPIPVEHAIRVIKATDTEIDTGESYQPFQRINEARPIGFGMRGIVVPKGRFKITPVLKRTLSMGMRGDDVKTLQDNLRKLGYFKFPISTGYFGLITKSAVKDFQREYGIIQTGNYGTLTHTQLYKLI